MATAEEDFSFPTTTADSPPRFIESPPLWRPSPSPTSTSGHQKPEKFKGKEVENEEKFNLGSFQELNKESPSLDEDEEEKMDMLWEDLNEESSRSRGKMIQKYDISSPGKEVHGSCVKALKLSKASGVHMKKPSILVLIKVLKKFFLMHKPHRTIKKHAW